ncbi:electron transfer flavoprotein subunit alpha/FixB family protein [Eggerthellaceae bacterium zg-1084]|uniref:electron transfer flavoprotein subunit alpha/FixB family protein n=1 Tax=Berryella wangjianweii TaxID=2734634 RepID=UPI0015570237|nr:electron transfer flavoprotein subunit alpha/FixB family protein [Berryella wangjianweii]NPD31540.1 electron transfer flavoprotein subunit alpha/FixB family protein [Berryella wangjianweii]NPD32965.1 electron transfer flavoprotein subunit alpha/FixB family protein [Eggerthellaceae bacterium zg-997]
MKALVLSEHADAAASLAAGARKLADEVVVVMVGAVEAPASCADFVGRIEIPDGLATECAGETLRSFVAERGFELALVEPTRRLKVLAGGLAAQHGVSVITDVVSFEADGAKSLFFGGVAERVQKGSGSIAIYTVAAGALGEGEPSGANTPVDIAWVEPEFDIRVVKSEPIEKSGVDLTKASVVVAAGRGFSEKGDLELAHQLCEKIGAGLGCSRPLTEGVDWLPSETYIGVSGLMLTPKVYIAAGISGQMQHMVGCNRSDVIFAINKDKNAPVFKQCDYGLVGDLKTVLPALVAAL